MSGKLIGLKTKDVKSEMMCNIRAEQELLGVVVWLIANDHDKYAEEVINILRPLPDDLFYRHQHRCLFKILISLDNQEMRSLSYIEAKAKQDGCWSEDCDSKHDICNEFLQEISEKGDLTLTLKTKAYTPAEFALELLGILERHCIERRVHSKRVYLSNLALEATSISEIRHLTDTIKDATRPIVSSKKDASSVYEILNKHIKSILDGNGATTNILTGLYNLDEMTGGFAPGSLIVLGARPSMGKSSLAVDFALAAAKSFFYTAYFSFEMPKSEVLQRIISKETEISIYKLRNSGRKSDFEKEKIDMFMRKPPYPLFIVDRNCKPDDVRYELDKIVSQVKCEKTKGSDPVDLGPTNIDFVIIDYIGLMGGDEVSKYQRRDLQIGAYTSALKALAIARNCCVLVVSQLNRDIEGRPDKKPRLSDLRESGSLEQDADIVLFLHREGSDATLTIAKNRNGPIGEQKLLFIENTATFKNQTTREG